MNERPLGVSCFRTEDRGTEEEDAAGTTVTPARYAKSLDSPGSGSPFPAEETKLCCCCRGGKQHTGQERGRRAVMLAVVPGAQRVLVRQVRRKTLVGSYHPAGAAVFAGASGTRVPPHLDRQCPTAGVVRRLALRPRSSR